MSDQTSTGHYQETGQTCVCRWRLHSSRHLFRFVNGAVVLGLCVLVDDSRLVSFKLSAGLPATIPLSHVLCLKSQAHETVVRSNQMTGQEMKPKSVAFEVTADCNRRCIYCYNSRVGSGPSSRGVSLTQTLGLLDKVLTNNHVEQVTLTGGEPFLHPALFDIIDHVRSYGTRFAIISNAGCLDVGIVAALSSRDPSYVQVTFAGPSADLHDSLCGRGAFTATVHGVNLMVDAGVPVGGSLLCTRTTAHETGATLDAMLAFGIRKHVTLNRYCPAGNINSMMLDLLPTRENLLQFLAAAERFAASNDMPVTVTMPIPYCLVPEEDYPHIRFTTCGAGAAEGECVVDSDGMLRLCPLQKTAIGDLRKHSFAELLSRPAVAWYRQQIPMCCRPCPRSASCLGGCGASAEWVLGLPSQLDPLVVQHLAERHGADDPSVVGSGDHSRKVSEECAQAKHTPETRSRIPPPKLEA